MDIIILTLFLASSLLLMGYYLYYFNPVGKLEKQEVVYSELPISVVICAKNEAENLKQNLTTILNQKYPNFEVLVVNDHSTDNTQEILKQLQENHPNLRHLDFNEEKKNQGKKEALAFGIKNAKYEHLLLTDADCQTLSNHWIANMSQAFHNEQDLVLGISLYPLEKKTFLNWMISSDALLIAINYIGWSLRNNTYMSVGRNVAYTKTLFLKTGGFTNHMHLSSGDDDLFVQEAKNKGFISVVIDPDSQTCSAPVCTWKTFFKQKTRHLSTGTNYPFKILLGLASFQVAVLVFYFSFLVLLTTSTLWWIALFIFFLKKIVQTAIFKRIFSKIGVSLSIAPFLFFELVWVVLLMGINFRSLLSTKNNGGTWS